MDNLDLSGIQGLLEGMPSDGSPAEYVTWFANMLKAVFELVSGLFSSFMKKKDEAENTANG